MTFFIKKKKTNQSFENTSVKLWLPGKRGMAYEIVVGSEFYKTPRKFGSFIFDIKILWMFEDSAVTFTSLSLPRRLNRPKYRTYNLPHGSIPVTLYWNLLQVCSENNCKTVGFLFVCLFYFVQKAIVNVHTVCNKRKLILGEMLTPRSEQKTQFIFPMLLSKLPNIVFLSTYSCCWGLSPRMLLV